MTFTSILILVLVAAVILAVMFASFHIFIALIPVVLILAILIWIINRFSNKKNNDNMPSDESAFRYSSKGHKKARNVSVKDIKDK